MDHLPRSERREIAKQKHIRACIAHRDAVDAWEVWEQTKEEQARQHALELSEIANALTRETTPQATSLDDHRYLFRVHLARRSSARF